MLRHLSGKIKSFLSSDSGILRKNIGNQTVLIVLDNSPCNSKIPQSLADRPAEHNPGRAPDTAEFIEKKYLGYPGLSVSPRLHEKALFPDDKKITGKYVAKKGQYGS